MTKRSLSLSTMYAQQERFADGAAFARYAAEAGYDGIEISHSTDAAKFQGVLDAGHLPVTSVHQPSPRAKLGDGRWNSKPNLASPDEAERRVAVAHAVESLAWAARIGATRSICHLGAVGDHIEMFDEEFQMRRLFDSGRAAEPAFAALREAAIAKRKQMAEPFVEAARRSLQELVRVAERDRIAVGVENRYHFHEIPHPDEYDVVLEGLAPAQAGYWHDVGHAEVLHRLGFLDRHAWLQRNSHRCIGAHLHDVLGIGDHRAPGDGDVDWGYVAEGVRHLRAYTLEINQWQPDERVTGARAFLESVGLG
jgi:sugar phosphate isomerase/epimerase